MKYQLGSDEKLEVFAGEKLFLTLDGAGTVKMASYGDNDLELKSVDNGSEIVLGGDGNIRLNSAPGKSVTINGAVIDSNGNINATTVS